MAPAYLTEMFEYKKTRYSLRSETNLDLLVPKYKTTFGERALAIQGPKLWNKLPLSVKCSQSFQLFQRMLKAHLFECAFNDV